MTYTAISVIGMEICVVADRIVSQWRLQCCRMAITTCQQAVKLSPPTSQHHHLMIASTVVPIPIWLQSRMSLTAGQHGKAYQKRDASLLRCTLRSQQQLARAESRYARYICRRCDNVSYSTAW